MNPVPTPLGRRHSNVLGAAFLVLATSASCISLESRPLGYEPMCARSSECDPGERCDEGICWGNPPDRQFAAMLLPPVDGPAELAPTQITGMPVILE